MAAVVKFKEACQRFTFFERNDGKQGVACEGEVQSGVGSAMPVAILLPGRGVAFVVVAVLYAPVTSDGLYRTGFFLHQQAGEEETGVALEDLRVFFSNQSRCKIMAQRTPGSPAVTRHDNYVKSGAFDFTIIAG